MAKKILIIEDEISIAELEKDYLQLSGFEVVMKHDGQEGEAEALNGDYDLILLDIMLPGTDGFDILKSVRAKKDTPILLVTARKEEIDKVWGLGLGADDYITKPFSPSELVARVKAHLARYERLTGAGGADGQALRAAKRDELVIRGLRIDMGAHRVWVDDEEKNFTGKEYDLLLFLAQHPNRVYTKEELFKEIWDMNANGDIATITVHIKKIREKIEYNTAKPQYIETVWGVGYRFRA